MSTLNVFNTTDGPLVVDDKGHTVAGKSWGKASADNAGVTWLLDAGVLIRKDGDTTAKPAAAKTTIAS